MKETMEKIIKDVLTAFYQPLLQIHSVCLLNMTHNGFKNILDRFSDLFVNEVAEDFLFIKLLR